MTLETRSRSCDPTVGMEQTSDVAGLARDETLGEHRDLARTSCEGQRLTKGDGSRC